MKLGSAEIAKASARGDVEYLISALNGDPSDARFAARELLRLDARESIPTLELKLTAEDPFLRAVIVRTLGKFGSSAEKLHPLSKADPVPYVRGYALEAYADQFMAEAERDLIEGLADDDWRVRKIAVIKLARFGSSNAIEPLERQRVMEPRVRRPTWTGGSPLATKTRHRGNLTRRDYNSAIRNIRLRID